MSNFYYIEEMLSLKEAEVTSLEMLEVICLYQRKNSAVRIVIPVLPVLRITVRKPCSLPL